MKIPFFLFLRTNIKFGIKIIEIDFSNMKVEPSVGPQGGMAKKSAVAHSTHMKIWHTKLGWILING